MTSAARAIDFTDIVYNTDTVLVTKKEVADNYQKPEDLAGHKIAAQTGSKPYERAVAFAGTENMVGLAKVPDLILEVQNGKTEGAVMDELVAQAYVNADPSLAISRCALISDPTAVSASVYRRATTSLSPI